MMQVSAELGWTGSFGDCWMNATLEFQEYFAGCNYTDSESSQLYNLIYSWSDMRCFTRVFSQACTVFLKNEFYAWSSSGQYESPASNG